MNRASVRILAAELGTVVLLASIAVGGQGTRLLRSSPLADEQFYLAAAAHIAQGTSPYQGGWFLYLPAFAIVCHWIEACWGSLTLLALFRLANALSVATIVWWAVNGWKSSWRYRFGVAVLYLVLAEPVRYALLWGNISPIAVVLLLYALARWSRLPRLAGGVLGATLAIKPLTFAAVALVFAHRDAAHGRPWDRLRPEQILVGLYGALLALFVIALPPYLSDFLALQAGRYGFTRNVSLHRVLHCFGLDMSALVLAIVVLVLALALARLRSWSPAELPCLIVPATLLTLPVVWSHTLLLSMPLQVAALDVATRRWWRALSSIQAPRSQRSRLLLDLVLVIGSTLAAQLAQGVGGIDDRPLLVQGVVGLCPLLGVCFLAFKCVRYQIDPLKTAPAC